MRILNVTQHPLSILCIVIFIMAYIAVMCEEKLRLSKSKPILLAAGIIWILIAVLAHQLGVSSDVHAMVRHNLTEYAAIFLFLLVAMTYVNTMEDRNVFAVLKVWLITKQFTFRKLFWITGFLAFFISPVADNLTTALLMGTVIMAIGKDHPRFVAIAMINIVVAANAGGAFSPFGDITTLMVWQAKKADFFDFFKLFLPAIVNFLVPALVMSFFIPNLIPTQDKQRIQIKPGGLVICALFFVTIILAVCFEQLLSLPAFMGMMTGFSLLMIFIYFLQQKLRRYSSGSVENDKLYLNIFHEIAMAEWDTLLFFFGVIFSVGGLATLGYLAWISEVMYTNWGPSATNIVAGLVSSIVDNIPVMFAILSMNPQMDTFQWLLITLTAGVGGSLLSLGSAAGVALMGISKGRYTFMSHLKWSWLILAGYIASIFVHFGLNF